MEEMGVNLRDMFGNLFPTKTVRRKMKVAEARGYLIREEQERLVSERQLNPVRELDRYACFEAPVAEACAIA